MKLAVTGASGYIGARLVSRALAQGHEVVSLSRAPTAGGAAWTRYDLADVGPLELSEKTDAVIHLAATTHVANFDEEAELRAAQRLICACARVGARLVFVSSQTARADAPTSYGRSKAAIESAVLAVGGVAIRPGLVYGGDERGLFGALVALTRRWPALPAFWPAPYVQPLHVDDLVEALLRTVARPDLGGQMLRIGAVAPLRFSDFLAKIAKFWLRKNRLFVPAPTLAVRVARGLVGAELGARLKLDRLLSLFALPAMQTRDDLQRLGLTPRSLEVGLCRGANGPRRARLLEGRALLAYVLRVPPRPALTARYVRAIEALRGGGTLGLPAWTLGRPATLALWEGVGEAAPELAWRLHAASALAEATPQGAARFLRLGGSNGFLRALAAIGLAGVSEGFWRLASLVASPWLRRSTSAT